MIFTSFSKLITFCDSVYGREEGVPVDDDRGDDRGDDQEDEYKCLPFPRGFDGQWEEKQTCLPHPVKQHKKVIQLSYKEER